MLHDTRRAGFAVAATDCHGLGTPSMHQYVSPEARANDVIYSVPGRRSAVAALGRRRFADGHSPGGLAAWGVAEAEIALGGGPGYLGAVSVARPAGLLRHLAGTAGVRFHLAWMAYDIHARCPSFAVTDMLTPPALRRQPAASAGVPRVFAENALGEHPDWGPLLVIAGAADAIVPIDGVRQTVERACRGGSPQLRFPFYPGPGHPPAMAASLPDPPRWIRARFAGALQAGSCAAP